MLLFEPQVTDQKEEGGACQPEVPPPVTVDVEVLGWQVAVGIQYLQRPLMRRRIIQVQLRAEFPIPIILNHI